MAVLAKWLIGSAPECDLVVEAGAVSGRHCIIANTDQGLALQDLDSTNGTYVNGVRISTTVRVQPTDRITLGQDTVMPWPAELGLSPAAARPARQVTQVGSPTARVISIGYDDQNDVVLAYPTISGQHARLVVHGKEMILEDLNSTNGTAIGTPHNRVQRTAVTETDNVYFGSLRVPVTRLLEGSLNLGDEAARLIDFKGQEMILGRDPSCHIVLDYPMVSSRHARLTRISDQVTLEDLGSRNGTFLNGKPISHSMLVNPGDQIGLGSYTLELTSLGQIRQRDYSGNLAIEIRNVVIDVPGKRLLEKVSMTIYPSEFVALMGPSGAGKTTLMNAMNGYTPPVEGNVLFNGQDLYSNYAQFSGLMGYVPQDDIIHRELTVRQALFFTAKLRLPPDTSRREIDDRIAKTLKQLGLDGVGDVLIGSAEKKGISGGQRKRVNLAMELLTDPSVMFLDEPTSGLSSEDTLMVMKVLRDLADSGKTILLTIHQPSLEAYRLMDNLLLVCKDHGSSAPGQLVYYGPAYPDAVDFFNPDGIEGLKPGMEPSPDEVLRGLAKGTTEEWANKFGQSEYKKEYVLERQGKSPASTATQPKIDRRFVAMQWWTLVMRCLRIKISDRWNTAILLAQAPIVGFLIMMVFGEQLSKEVTEDNWPDFARKMGTTVFLLSLSSLWFGCSNAVREIVGEWAIYHRERMVNLQIPAYVASKFTVLGLFCVIQCVLLTSMVYFGCNLKMPFVACFLVLMLVSFVGMAIGLVISSLAKTSEMAIGLMPIILIPMVVLGGVLVQVDKMSPPVKAVSAMIPTRWCFEALLVLEAKEQPLGRSYFAGMGKGDSASKTINDNSKEDIASLSFPTNSRVGTTKSVIVLFVMLIVLVTAVCQILRSRDVH